MRGLLAAQAGRTDESRECNARVLASRFPLLSFFLPFLISVICSLSIPWLPFLRCLHLSHVSFFDILSWGGLSSGSSSFFLIYFIFSSFNPSFRKITAFTGLLGNSSKASTTKENRRERDNFFSVDANTHQNVFETTPKPI